MNPKDKENLPFTLVLLCMFYVINAILFLATCLIFSGYLDVIIFGGIAQDNLAFLIRVILTVSPLYLAFGLAFLRKDSYFLAIIYHLFFLINSVLVIFCLQNINSRLSPILKIASKPEYGTIKLHNLLLVPFHTYLLQILGIVIGLLVILYLLTKRNLFKA